MRRPFPALIPATAIVLCALPVLLSCPRPGQDAQAVTAEDLTPDPHSLSRPAEVGVEHLSLDLAIDFDNRRIEGRATLHVDNRTGSPELWLDTHGLDIRGARLGTDERETSFRLGPESGGLGRPLIVTLEPGSEIVHVDYATRPGATALQWLEPRQTAGGRHPFLLTQSQTIFARTWVPCQDTPSVRSTYDARVRVPPGLMALMSAENPTEATPDGVYTFRMAHPVPSYLLALAVGELEFRPVGQRSGVYAEPPVVERAAWEFAEAEQMIDTAEALVGPYRWGRFDVLVLPASFPFGGMENPRLTFVTPTLLAGDRSLVSTLAHELAHSWSGNLVTNATWSDVWLNEGITVYLERRIMEARRGEEYAEMLALLGLQDLQVAFADLGATDPDTRLALDLDGRDPEASFSDVAYEKGYQFLRMIEEAVGRDEWDRFLRGYFDEFAFGAMTTERFLAYLQESLLATLRPETVEALGVEAWLYGTGLPANAPEIRSEAFERVDGQLRSWMDGSPAAELDTTDWTTHHWVHFIRALPPSVDRARLGELDREFALTDAGNAEVLHAWLMQALARGYGPADAALERFLVGVGRLKFLEPLYERMSETPAGMARARRIYDRARPGYHAVSATAVDGILGWPGESPKTEQ